GTVAPCTASAKSMRMSVSTSAPRRARVDVDGPPPPLVRPNRPPSRSPRPPDDVVVDAPPGNRSPRSNPPVPPPKPPAPGRNAPDPNRLRASSYCLRLAGSDSTPYASETALKRASALASPGLASGCSSLASLRYAFLISSAPAEEDTPSSL